MPDDDRETDPWSPWIDPGSSNISQWRYNSADRLMEVEFKHGGTYTYHGIELDLWSALVHAESAGKALDKLVKKPGYRFTKN